MVDDDVPSGPDDEGPTADDLAAIVAEEPLIAARVALVDAQIRAVTAEDGPTPLDVLRVRQAQARVAREALAYRAAVADQAPPADDLTGGRALDEQTAAGLAVLAA